MKPFHYLRPGSVEEALNCLKGKDGKVKIIAGGTDVLVSMRNKKITPEYLVSIKDITELNYIKRDQDALRIGALTTHRQLEMNDFIKCKFTVLHDAINQIGSIQIRNVATIGGNLCSALPSADSASPLMVLNAQLKLLGPGGERVLPVKDFFLQPGQNALKFPEILAEIIIPIPPENSNGAYHKFGRRKAMEIPLLGAAAFIEVQDSICKDARIALTTAAPTPIRAYKAEQVLKGRKLTNENLLDAGEKANSDASPRSSWRSTEEFRRKLIPVLVYRSCIKAINRLND